MDANKDEGEKCKRIANKALDAGEYDKALRFAEKAVRLQGSGAESAEWLSDFRRKVSNRNAESRTENSESKGAGIPGPSGMRGGNIRRRDHLQRDERTNGMRSVDSSNNANDTVDTGTPEQQRLVRSVCSKTCYYEILGVDRSATDNDIKKSYRKLSLKVHPDKNKAKGADEAFKKVSRAFSCLSDSGKRRVYDQFGHDGDSENSQMRSNANFRSFNRNQDPFGVFFEEDFDADEIFRMFFGGNPFMATQRYQPQRHYRQTARHSSGDPLQNMGTILRALSTLLPILVLLFINFFSKSPKPAYSLQQSGQYNVELNTKTHGIPFYVPSEVDFASKYPTKTIDRRRIELEIEKSWEQMKRRACYQEQLQKRHYEYYGQKKKADAVKTTSCDALDEMFRKPKSSSEKENGKVL